MAAHLAEEKDIQILRTIFPDEIWQTVLQNVQQPEDYTKIANSSPVFRNVWLLPHWSRVILPKVLYLLDTCIQYHIPSGRKELQKLRLICPAWKDAVDNFLENSPEHFMLSHELSVPEQQRNDPRPKLRSVNLKVLASIQDVTNFRKKFDCSHLSQKVNPFVGRELRIWLSLDLESFHEFTQAILNLLRDYGSHVWYLLLGVSVQNQNQSNLLKFGFGEWIKDILLLVPSLRTLRFAVPNNFNNFTGIPTWQNIFTEMKQYWEENGMPYLKNLIMIGEFGLPWPILLALLRANPQVSILESHSLLKAERARNVLETHVPRSLQKFGITVGGIPQLETFHSAQVDWPLETLCVDARDPDILWANIMAIVKSKFGSVLHQLYVSAFVNPQLPDIPVAPLNIPNLEMLHLAIVNFSPEFDFLLPVGTTLRTLYVEFDWSIPFFTDNENETYSRLSRLPRQSDLWQLLPKLQKFGVLLQHGDMNFCWYNCTRGQSETFQKTQSNL